MEEDISKSAGKKRARESETEAAEIESAPKTSTLENCLTFSDTLIALQMMRAQFPKIDKVSLQPFILRSQLYSSVKDRTQVDRDLESLKKDNILRIFKLNTGQDDHAILFMEDYLIQISLAEKRMEAKKKDDAAVLDWFKTNVVVSKLDPSIEHEELCSLLSVGVEVKDRHISLLIDAGLLTRQLVDSNVYWFSIPNIGSVLKGLSQVDPAGSRVVIYESNEPPFFSQFNDSRCPPSITMNKGRKELLSLLNRQKYKEMALAALEKKRLRMSFLDMRFHLRDLIGSGHVKTVNTPTGLVVRISKD